MTIVVLIAATVVSVVAPVESNSRVRFLDGRTIEGDLVAISNESLVLARNGTAEPQPLNQILEVSLADNPPTVTSPQEIRLSDGTVLSCDNITRTGQQLSADAPDLGQLTIPAGLVAAVRLQAPDAGTEPAWKEFLQRRSDKDLLVVPKRDGTGLDFLTGIVSSISETQLSFLLDGDTIPVPRARVFGVIFAPSKAPPAIAAAAVHTLGGDLVSARNIKLQDGILTFESSWQQSLVVPVDKVQRIDFSRGRIHYLADLQPVSESFLGIDPENDLFSGLIDAETARILYGPARNRTIENNSPLRLRGRTFDRGLCLHSRTELVFALDRRYASLEALAGVDDQVAFNLDREVLLVITADGEEIFRHTFQTRDDPLPISLPVSNVQTLTLLVDFADNNSQCDWLDLADARLILATEEP